MGETDLAPAEIGNRLLADIGHAHAHQIATVKGEQMMHLPNSLCLAYSRRNASDGCFIVSSVNQVFSVSVFVRPGRCS